MPATTLPKLTVPRTYMSACGVQSEIATKTLAKVARHDAAYRIEVDRYRHNLENHVKTIKREQNVLRASIRDYEERLNLEPALDEEGKVKAVILKRRVRQRKPPNTTREVKLKQRAERTRKRQDKLLHNFYHRVEGKIHGDLVKQEAESGDMFGFEKDSGMGNDPMIGGSKMTRKNKHMLRIAEHQEDASRSPSELSTYFDISDSESEDDDEDKFKRDGGIPKVSVRRVDPGDLFHGRRSKEGSTASRKKEIIGPMTDEQKKHEHEVKVQQVSQRYVQFLARNAEANKEKEAAAKRTHNLVDITRLQSSSLPPVTGRMQERERSLPSNHSPEGADGGKHLHVPGRRRLRTTDKGLSKQASFMQLVRLQQSSGISSNLQLIDRLLHRKVRERMASMPKLEEENEERLGEVSDDSRPRRHKTPATVQEPRLERRHKQRQQASQITTKASYKNDSTSSDGPHIKRKPKTDENDLHKSLPTTFGFPRRLIHTQRWNYYAAVRNDIDNLPSSGRYPPNPHLRRIIPVLDGPDQSSLEDILAAEKERLLAASLGSDLSGRYRRGKEHLAPQPKWITSLRVTGQGLLYPGTLVDEYIDKKLRREKMNSARRRQVLIWREALAQIRKVHYLSHPPDTY